MCDSSILVDREPDRLALVCLGCGRHWEQSTRGERPFQAALLALRARQPVRPARLP